MVDKYKSATGCSYSAILLIISEYSWRSSLTDPQLTCYFLRPSELPNQTADIRQIFDQVVGKMVEYGFNNSFANVEVFICDTEEVRLILVWEPIP